MIDINKLYTESPLINTGITIKASPLLKNIISHYSFSLVKVSKIKSKLSVIPDASGCIVFTFYDTHMESKVWGATSHITEVNKTEEKQALLFMIEFMQGGLKHFTSECQSDLNDQIVDLKTINKELNNMVKALYESSTSINEFITKLEINLIKLLDTQTYNDTFRNSINIVKNLSGNISVKSLSNTLNYSERQLSRIYKEHLGINAKNYIQLVKINKILLDMQLQNEALASLAYSYQYHDESHLIKSFKSICGVTPKSYKENMSDFYNESLKF